MTELSSAPFGVGPLNGATGYGLLLGLCALLFIEECGVPLPFAPGDVVLLFCGITIATNHLNIVVAISVVTASVVVGAMAGREFFHRAGSPLVHRLAKLLRLGAALERMAAALRKHGWYGVLIGRLTPGLRVHTTEAAGVIGMSRRTFAAGLIPAVMVYEGIFLGLGLWLGPAANQAIHEYTPTPGPLIVMVAAAIGLVVTVRWLIAFFRNRTTIPRPVR